MTRSIGRQQRAAARKKAKDEGRFEVIDGGKALPKPPMLTTLTILVPQSVGDAINSLHEFVKGQYPSRNDFLEDLLKEGLRSALAAQREAFEELRKKQIEAEAEKDKAGSLIVLPPGARVEDYVGSRTPVR